MFTRSETTRFQTLDAVIDYWDLHGESPTYKELGDILGVSEAAAHNRVKNLEKWGHVEITDRTHRNIILVDKRD